MRQVQHEVGPCRSSQCTCSLVQTLCAHHGAFRTTRGSHEPLCRRARGAEDQQCHSRRLQLPCGHRRAHQAKYGLAAQCAQRARASTVGDAVQCIRTARIAAAIAAAGARSIDKHTQPQALGCQHGAHDMSLGIRCGYVLATPWRRPEAALRNAARVLPALFLQQRCDDT